MDRPFDLGLKLREATEQLQKPILRHLSAFNNLMTRWNTLPHRATGYGLDRREQWNSRAPEQRRAIFTKIELRFAQFR